MNVNRELIKELRLKKSWSQEKLADMAGVRLRTIQRIETDGVASLQSRTAIANAFEIEPVELDVEVQGPTECEKPNKLQMRLVSFALSWVESVLRGTCIFLASVMGASLFAMALVKPFMPENVGLFTSKTSLSFGIIGNTVNMQEHLGYWVIPLALVSGWVLFKCVILLSGTKAKI
ncbi:MAG: helix-turn-helix transcriptional regulator [Proteobacteria bacterium]|nr:helix-turn-helix transcriptional regulator [Pseudomonadota bacterium]